MIHALKQIIEFIKSENPTNEKFEQFVSKMMEKDPSETSSEKLMKEHKENIFLSTDN